MDTAVSKIKGWFYKEKFTFLLYSLIFYMIAAPFFETFLPGDLLVEISFMVLLITAVFAASAGTKRLLFVIIITVLCSILFWYKQFYSSDPIILIELGIRLLFNGFMIYIITGDFYKSNRVSRDTISAALIAYLFLALFWSNLYFLTEFYYPNSFNIPHEQIMADPNLLRYFSFVTITTLGFGDISPIASRVRNLTVLEAFIGQMYVAVFVARLVAIHTSQAFEKQNE